MPILAVVPVPDWNSAELMMSVVLSHSGIKFTLPVPVTALFGGAFGAELAMRGDPITTATDVYALGG
jgi:hypothetical protein